MSNPDVPDSVHYKVGVLTRQLHDSLNELGYADRLRGSMGELPDAQSRLSYIARLTGEAAEKVLNRVELARSSRTGWPSVYAPCGHRWWRTPWRPWPRAG